MEHSPEEVSQYQAGDILGYTGNDERLKGQILVLSEASVLERYGTLLWRTRNNWQGSFTEDYLTENYEIIGNFNKMDKIDVSEND